MVGRGKIYIQVLEEMKAATIKELEAATSMADAAYRIMNLFPKDLVLVAVKPHGISSYRVAIQPSGWAQWEWSTIVERVSKFSS